ncbi:MAG: hypothetical protein ABIW76_13710 [Fibrobacteria bacterium]
MKPAIPFLILFLSLLPPAHAQTPSSRPDPGVRVAFMPMIGLIGGLGGWAADLGMGKGVAAWGVRIVKGSGMGYCSDCGHDPESEHQVAFLGGIRGEYSAGTLTLKTGLANVERKTWNGVMSPEGRYGFQNMIRYSGFGVPIQLDLALCGRNLGIGLSASAMLDKGGNSASLLIGVPMGILR